MVIGDFNDILTHKERSGSGVWPNWLYDGFREAILDCNIMDVPLLGHRFTWSRGRGANNLWRRGWIGRWRIGFGTLISRGDPY